ncbi:MAG: formylmethanofuran dehydrogenase subunit A [Planctomycetes bacterium]|nr:formylmethanofuran dehydrogenase subunit A [Planctomycetota bacterium]
MAFIKLANGIVHDPTNGIDGDIRDIWIEHGKIVAPPTDPAAVVERVYDLTGLVVMPGGVDMHAHIAGPKVNVARKLRPEDRRDNAPMRRTKFLRSGTLGSTPTTFATGYLYAGLGYTTVFDAAIPPLGARHTHEEFHDTPVIDKGFFVLVGNNHYLMDQLGRGEHERVRAFCGWLLHATRGYALKVVNPGGVEVWKQGKNGMAGLEDIVPGFGVSPRQIVAAVAQVADELKLPHSVHIHCNQLGMPGNWSTTLDTMRATEGHRAHFTHIQFHSYGGGPDDQGTFRSKVPELAEWVNAHANTTVDVGQVMFGDTTSMTGDGPLGHFLHRVTGRKWFNGDTECEGGCGIVPIEYKEKSFVHALQWAIGLEWYLLVRDPWRVAMSTDHPNGGSFLAYPEICALLMSRDYRREVLKRLPAKLKDVCSLPDLDREYTLQEIAIVTRAGPARILGLRNKGNLGIGADADITVYTPSADRKAMFELPRFVFKAGKLVVEQGEIRFAPYGPALVAQPSYDHEAIPHIREWFEGAYSLQFENYAVGDEYLTHGETVVECRSATPG